MNLVLKRFSQDVDLSNPEKVNYFLVLETPQGAEVRLPVQKETTETLVKLLYTGQAKAPKVEKTDVPTDKELDEKFEEAIEEFDENYEKYLEQKNEALEAEDEESIQSL